MTSRFSTLRRFLLIGVLGGFVGMAPAPSSGTTPDSTQANAETGGVPSSDHPAGGGAAHGQCRIAGADARSSFVREQRVGPGELVDPLRRSEFLDGAECRRTWMGGTCFRQERAVCSLIVFKVNHEWYMDCY